MTEAGKMTKAEIKAEVERRFDAELAKYGKAMGSWRKAKRNIRREVERECGHWVEDVWGQHGFFMPDR